MSTANTAARTHRPTLSPQDEARAMELLRRAVAEHPRGKAGVAERIGYSRPAVSRLLAGTYGNDTHQVLGRALKVLDLRRCPYLGIDIAGDDCRQTNHGPAPTWDPAALAQRRVCQTCQYRPEEA